MSRYVPSGGRSGSSKKSLDNDLWDTFNKGSESGQTFGFFFKI